MGGQVRHRVGARGDDGRVLRAALQCPCADSHQRRPRVLSAAQARRPVVLGTCPFGRRGADRGADRPARVGLHERRPHPALRGLSLSPSRRRDRRRLPGNTSRSVMSSASANARVLPSSTRRDRAKPSVANQPSPEACSCPAVWTTQASRDARVRSRRPTRPAGHGHGRRA